MITNINYLCKLPINSYYTTHKFDFAQLCQNNNLDIT